MSRWRLDGKRVLVTGSTKGIGLSVAREVLTLGAACVMIVSRNDAEISAVVGELNAEFGEGRAVGARADLSEQAGREGLVRAVEGAWGGSLDCLVNNAGTNVRKPVLQATDEEYHAIMNTNMDSCFFLCKLLHPLLKKGVSPSIVNVASVAGVGSTGSGGAYAMSKAAIIQLTKTLSCEWAKDGIRVNCVAPWVTKTPLLAVAVAKDPSVMDKTCKWTPMGRPAEPEEIAGGVTFFLLPSASYVTGQTLCVDGGLTANLFAGPCV